MSTNEAMCDRCIGTGWNNGGVCPHCGGTGRWRSAAERADAHLTPWQRIWMPPATRAVNALAWLLEKLAGSAPTNEQGEQVDGLHDGHTVELEGPVAGCECYFCRGARLE